MSLESRLQRIWYGSHPAAWVLSPLGWLFSGASGLRRWAFRRELLSTTRVSRPVIVVGNITVGGTGKTPFVSWLATSLTERGFRVGVLTRGYGGRAASWPQAVTADSDPAAMGDESVLLAQQTNAIIVAGPDRVASARRAIELGAQVVVTDDGLQHYQLARDVEIVIVDGVRGFGNARLLPAGPLREPRRRLDRASLIVTTRKSGERINTTAAIVGSELSVPRVDVALTLAEARNLLTGEIRQLDQFRGAHVHAIAGIGNPEAFFSGLEAAGLTIERHALPDHATISADDVAYASPAVVLMTEKDAVKCRAFAGSQHWSVALKLNISAADEVTLWSIVDPAINMRNHG